MCFDYVMVNLFYFDRVVGYVVINLGCEMVMGEVMFLKVWFEVVVWCVILKGYVSFIYCVECI